MCPLMPVLPLAPATPATPLHIEFRDVPLTDALATPGTLAVFGFGDRAAPRHDDPRYLHVALPSHGCAALECWQVATEVVNWMNGHPPGRLTLPARRAPESFEIAVNRQVARALGILLPSDEELLRLVVEGDKS